LFIVSVRVNKPLMVACVFVDLGARLGQCLFAPLCPLNENNRAATQGSVNKHEKEESKMVR
jgi:hypothetical protein